MSSPTPTPLPPGVVTKAYLNSLSRRSDAGEFLLTTFQQVVETARMGLQEYSFVASDYSEHLEEWIHASNPADICELLISMFVDCDVDCRMIWPDDIEYTIKWS